MTNEQVKGRLGMLGHIQGLPLSNLPLGYIEEKTTLLNSTIEGNVIYKEANHAKNNKSNAGGRESKSKEET